VIDRKWTAIDFKNQIEKNFFLNISLLQNGIYTTESMVNTKTNEEHGIAHKGFI